MKNESIKKTPFKIFSFLFIDSFYFQRKSLIVIKEGFFISLFIFSFSFVRIYKALFA